MQQRSQQQDRVLNAALPLMREYIIGRWWATRRQPVQASNGDAEVRQRARLRSTSNPAGWWGRAWTAVERHRNRAGGGDVWLVRFEPCFRGLRRVPDRQPYRYIVEDETECPPPQTAFQRAITMWAEGQARVETVEERQALEEAGMKAGRRWLRGQGFADEQITDTRATKSWDLEANDSRRKYYVEAKASRSAWSDDFSVIVTRNEVIHAQQHGDACALIVAASCVLKRGKDDRLVATPRETRVTFPWHPTEDTLVPIAYKHQVKPAASARISVQRMAAGDTCSQVRALAARRHRSPRR